MGKTFWYQKHRRLTFCKGKKNRNKDKLAKLFGSNNLTLQAACRVNNNNHQIKIRRLLLLKNKNKGYLIPIILPFKQLTE
ncbi:MAG: hypothetical protein ACJAYB_000478 [Psychromonas sp.]|jgi:hypothetical protein